MDTLVFSIRYESESGVEYALIVGAADRIGTYLGSSIRDQQADFIFSDAPGALFGIILRGRGKEKVIHFQGVSENAPWIPNPAVIEFVRSQMNVLFTKEIIEKTWPVQQSG